MYAQNNNRKKMADSIQRQPSNYKKDSLAAFNTFVSAQPFFVT